MKPALVTSLALSLSAALPAQAGAAEVKVMTQNQYLGSDFVSLATQPPEDVNRELVKILRQIAATDFRARAQRQAAQIARHLPDLVGLQEVWRLSCVDADPSDRRGCQHPSIADAFIDHLQVTLDALEDLGVDYDAVASVKNLDLSSLTITPEGAPPITPGGLPFRIAGVNALLVALDRDVILARAETVVDPVPVGFPAPVCRVSQQGCNYQVILPVSVELPQGLLQVNFERGFVAVDAMVDGREYRFVNTHPEIREPEPGNPLSRLFQTAQAAQLIFALSITPPELTEIIVGDINSAPEDEPVPGPLPLPPPLDEGLLPPYLQFVEAGYIDTWTLRAVARPGFTCCQDPDLRNRRSILDERIDMIFASDTPTAVSQVRVLGARVTDRTPPPGPRLWPSDHAGVVATLAFD